MKHCFLRQISLLGIILLFSANSRAGWTSSGGENLRDKINPWFLQNTQIVNYCILHDAENFGQPLMEVRDRVQKVLQIWKHQLQNLRFNQLSGTINGDSQLKLGTQNFIESNCEQAEIQFQFGVLTDEQFAKVNNPTRYMGLTVRTDYDMIQMRAKGFIYFSPERGPLKFNKVSLIENPWSRDHGSYLLLALLHEVGHIFGLQHDKELPFMDESYLENLFAKSNFEYNPQDNWASEIEQTDLFNKVNFFKVDAREDIPIYSSCSSSAVSIPSKPIKKPDPRQPSPFASANFEWTNIFDKFMGFKKSEAEPQSFCTKLYFKNNSEIVFESYQTNRKDKKTIIGRAEHLLRLDSGHDQYPIIKIWLPKTQKVVQFVYGNESNYLEKQIDFGAMQATTLFKGTYKVLESKLERPFFIQAKTFGHMRVGGTIDNTYYMDLYEGF